MSNSNEMQIGKAGEYLVCVDLIVKGFISFPSEQGLPYDVLLDNGDKLLKIQVKTTLHPREIPQRNKKSVAYIYNVKRKGKGGRAVYHENEVDIFALVALDSRKVGYVFAKDLPTTLILRDDRLRGSYYDEKGIKDYHSVIEHKKAGLTQTETAKHMGLAVATVNRIWQPNYEPFKTSAKYFSDIERGGQWFTNL